MMAQLQLDTNLDGYVSPLDALLVINDLNANGPHPFVLGGGSPRAGDLFVTMDSSPVRSRHLLGGVLSETVFRLHFRAEGERIDVTDLQLTSRGSNASSIDRLELYTDGSTTPFATATAGGCGSDLVPTVDNGMPVRTFCANMENGQLIVPEGQGVDVLVRARVKSDEQGALSGEPFQLFVSPSNASIDVTGEGAVRARGYESSRSLHGNDGDPLKGEGEVFIGVDVAAPNREIVSPSHTVVLATIGSVTNANPDADNTNVPTGVSSVGQFRFTAAANMNTLNGLNDFELTRPVFAVDSANVSINVDQLRFYNKANPAVYASAVAVGTNGVILHGNVAEPFTVYVDLRGTHVDRFVEPGQSDTFVLALGVTDPMVGSQGSSLRVSLLPRMTWWADPDIENVDAVFTGLGLADESVSSTLYRS